jgi:hypothetical protein
MDEQASFEAQLVLTRRRTGWNRLLVGVPVVAFAAIAWVGLSGARPSADAADRVVDASPAPSRPAPSLPIRMTPIDPPIAIPPWPDQVLGLEVRSPRDMNQLDLVGGPEIAVRGWYEAGSTTDCSPGADVPLPGDGSDPGVVSDSQTFCRRTGRLFATSPNANTRGSATYRLENRFRSDDLPAMSVAMRPGVVVPPPLLRTGEDAAPTVLVGRLVWPFDGCARFVTRCRPQLRVDRVIWAKGLGRTQTTSILPRLLEVGPQLSVRPRERLAEAVVGPTGAILMETLVDRETLAAVDPEAAALVAGAVLAGDTPQPARIWYRLALGPDPSRDPSRWIVIDDATGEAIASGWSGGQAGPRLPADGTNLRAGG